MQALNNEVLRYMVVPGQSLRCMKTEIDIATSTTKKFNLPLYTIDGASERPAYHHPLGCSQSVLPKACTRPYTSLVRDPRAKIDTNLLAPLLPRPINLIVASALAVSTGLSGPRHSQKRALISEVLAASTAFDHMHAMCLGTVPRYHMCLMFLADFLTLSHVEKL